MKTIKLLFLFLAVSAVTLYSCSDSDPIDNNANTTESIALRTALNHIKKANGITSRSATDSAICFNFVYPITLSLSNGTTVDVTSLAGLMELLENESPDTYISGIQFPFQVMQEGAISVVNNESDLVALLIECGISTWNDDLETTYCFDIVFPISVTTPNGLFEITTVQEFTAYLNAAENTQTYINFPFSVLFGGQTVVINNIYEAYEMINNCDGCVCTEIYEPVCVQTTNGVVEYGNSCFAICAGYSPSDFVSCNPDIICTVDNFTATTGACNTDGTYPLTLDFDFFNPGANQFKVYTDTNEFVGMYNVADLPVTIQNYPNNGQSTDRMYVVLLNGATSCVTYQQWTTPGCLPCNVTDEINPVCVMTGTGLVQFTNPSHAICAGYTFADFVNCGINPTNFGTALGSCFNLVYPVQIMAGGQIVTVNDNLSIWQYYNPAEAPVPNFVYPVTITQNTTTGATITTVIPDQASFVSIINDCN